MKRFTWLILVGVLGCQVPPTSPPTPPTDPPPVIITPPVEPPIPPLPWPEPVKKWLITITWDESLATDVVNYNVYVDTGGTQSILRPKRPPAEVQVWDNDGPPEIWVTAIDFSGNESERSDSIIVDLVETTP